MCFEFPLSVGEDASRATQDYDDAVSVIEKDIGLKAQLEHGKESPPNEHKIDLRPACSARPTPTPAYSVGRPSGPSGRAEGAIRHLQDDLGAGHAR